MISQELHDAVAILLAVDRGDEDVVQTIVHKYSADNVGELFKGMTAIAYKLTLMLAKELKSSPIELLEGALEKAFR